MNEQRELVGSILDHMQPQIVGACEEWIRDGKDITDVALLLRVEATKGVLNATARVDLQKLGADSMPDFPSLCKACCEVQFGPRDKIPIILVMSMCKPIGFELVWLDPIDPDSVH